MPWVSSLGLRARGRWSATAADGLWRVRIGDYRIVYAIMDAELVVLALRIAHRSNVYRNL
jgi:mRNA interferase RelE/StbE